MATIIRIKYAENIAQQSEVNNTSGTSSEASVPEKVLLVNINCNTGLIVDYIRETAHLGSTVEFDLWEESTSQLKNISSRKPQESGLEVFRPNNTYFLIIIERDSNGQVINYVPLISGTKSRGLSELMGKIRRQTRKSSSTKNQDKGGRKKSQGKSKSSDHLNI